MICDILLLAEAHIKLPTNAPKDDSGITSLPISRANMHPGSYLSFKDSILDIIDVYPSDGLAPARELLQRFRARKLYKKVAEEAIICSDGKTIDKTWQRKIWEMDELEICKTIVKCGKLNRDATIKLEENDIIIEKREIHHGMKADNPVSRMRFLPKSQLSKLREAPENLPIAKAVPEKAYECVMPRAFLQRTLRVYCRDLSDDKPDFLTTCYYQFIENMKKRTPNNDFDDDTFDAPDVSRDEINILSQSPTRASNDAFAYSNQSFPCDTDYEPKQKKPRKSREGSTFFTKVFSQMDSPESSPKNSP